MKRFFFPLLLTAALLAAAPYTMTRHQGFIAVRENDGGRWIYRSEVPVDALAARDQLLLELGLGLYDRADFTRAVEDFCS